MFRLQTYNIQVYVQWQYCLTCLCFPHQKRNNPKKEKVLSLMTKNNSKKIRSLFKCWVFQLCCSLRIAHFLPFFKANKFYSKWCAGVPWSPHPYRRGIFYFPVPILDLIFGMFSDLRKPIFLKPYEHHTISQNLDQWMWRITKSTTTLVGSTKSLTCEH